MRRGPIGEYRITAAGGEEVRAFLPAALPPNPPVSLSGDLRQSLESALLALGRLDSVSTLLPDRSVFLYSYVRKEAVLSSQIEGTQSSLSELLLFELDDAPGAPDGDVVEVSNYVAAMEHGLDRIASGFPLSNRLLREVHGILLRGSNKSPGEFRRSQNWIGGSRPGNAVFVPPPPADVPRAMGDLEQFLHRDDGLLPLLARIGLGHLQFETIHPFLDGNGRVGRLMITLQLCADGVLSEPLLYLSVYLKRHRDRYYQLLNSVRKDGNWEQWLVFFLEGVRSTAEESVATTLRLNQVFELDRQILLDAGRKGRSAARVLDVLRSRPVVSIGLASGRTGLSFPTVTSALALMSELGITRELTGKRRSRIFGYTRYLAILNES